MARVPLADGDPSRIGRYRLTARLGAGGMGVVYLGTARDGSQAAIKVLRPELADDHEFRARFRREVQVLARVQGLCTVRVIDADTESAKPFLATEYADGPSLAEHVGRHGPLAPGLLYGLAAGLAEALVAIHAAGIIHRDLKPGNVLLTRAGPKVIDFGIAQAMDATVLTRTGMTVGSPGFMAPEQITGQAGQPADIFSWGLTLAYAASGRPPFGTGPSDAILYRILNDSPDTDAVPTILRPLVQAALAKNPAERPTSDDLLGKLTPGTDAADTDTHPPTQTVLSRAWLLPAPAHEQAGGPGKTSRRRPLALLAAAACLAAAAGAGAAFMAGPAGKSQAGPAATRTPSAKDKPRPTSTPAVAAAAAQPLLVLSNGSYSGTEPTELSMGANNLVSGIAWSQWNANGAVGTGSQDIDSCQPSCAGATVTYEPVTVTLGGVEGASGTNGGTYTTFSETDRNTGQPVNAQYGHSVGILAGASGGTEISAAATTVCTTPVVSQNCSDASGLENQPSEITNSVDGSGYIKNLTWTDWGTATATGTGTMEVDNCTPNCAQGHDTPYAATVTLTRLVPYGNGYQAYAAMAISVPGASFLSERFSTGLVPLLRACLILITDVMPQRR